jgi:hypothetical protein
MRRLIKWLAAGLLLFGLAAAAAVYSVQHWLRTDDFRGRVERQAAQALGGMPLKMDKLSVDMWPVPAIAADNVRIATNPPLTIARIEARPVWSSLTAGELEIDTLVIEDAVVPQGAVNAIGAALQRRAKAEEADKKADPDKKERARPRRGMRPPRNVQLKKVTWADAKQRITIEAEIGLGNDGLLDVARFKVVEGRLAGASGTIERSGDDWPVNVKVGGGTIAGSLQIKEKNGLVTLTGQLATENVEVAALTAPSKTLTGKLQGQTQLQGQFREIAQLADVLVTQTHFSVKDALVSGIDLAKAVETVGLNQGGTTRLETLTGQLQTQGKTVHLTRLLATAGPLRANGNVTMAPSGSLSGRIHVDVATVRGGVGVPLQVGGTAEAPTVMLTRSALLGAAVGTVVAPGVGTGAGATLGDQVGGTLRGLFGR